MDSAIHWINIYPQNNTTDFAINILIHWIVIYSVDKCYPVFEQPGPKLLLLFMRHILPHNQQKLSLLFIDLLSIICLFVYFFLHSFILQAIYIVLQDVKMKMLFVEKISGYKNKWREQDIVKLITCPLIKLQFYLG